VARAEDVFYRLSQLERMVDHLYAHLGIDPPPLGTSVSDRVRQLVADGNAIEAIRVHRSETGKDLSDAKRDIDALH
jgi:hypothetical protein